MGGRRLRPLPARIPALMLDLAVLALLLLVALGVGRRLLAAVPFEWALEEAIFAIALGLGLLAYVTLALAEASLLGRPALLAALALAAAWSRRELVAGVALGVRGARRWLDGSPTRSERAALALRDRSPAEDEPGPQS